MIRSKSGIKTSKKERIIQILLDLGFEVIEDTDGNYLEFSSVGGTRIERKFTKHNLIRFIGKERKLLNPKRFGFYARLGEGLNIRLIEFSNSSSGDA